MRRHSGSRATASMVRSIGLLLAGLVVLSACGQTPKTPAANADPKPSATSEPTLPTRPVTGPPGIGVFAAQVNATGVGPADYPIRLTSGRHSIYVQFACSGPGAATITNAAGRRLLSVILKPSEPHCQSGFTYGSTWTSTTRADSDIHLAVATSMHWAMQIWVQ